jgi:hypothetical protein
MLIWAHSTWIDIQIGIEFPHPNGKAARLQQRAQGRGCNTLSKRRSHSAGYKDEPGRHVALMPSYGSFVSG